MPDLPLILPRMSWHNIFIWTEATERSSMGCGVTIIASVSRSCWDRPDFLASFPGADAEIPSSVKAFLVNDLSLQEGSSVKGYFDLGGQRKRHLALIRQRYGFTEFADDGPARFRLARWLYALCWSGDDHPGPLVERATSWLIVNKVMLPGVSVLERFVGRIRDRAQKRLWKRLVAALDDRQRERIAKLFDEDSETRFTALDSLRMSLSAERDVLSAFSDHGI